MLAASVAFAVPIGVSYVFLRRRLGLGTQPAVLAAGLAIGAGTGLSAAEFIAWRFFAPLNWFGFYPWIDAVFWIGLAAMAVRCSRGEAAIPAPRDTFPHKFVVYATVAMVGGSLAFFALHSIVRPHGDWDAWAIWNAKARFLFRGGANWMDFFTPAVPHPGYPLLVPAAVARLWMWAGTESTIVPMVVAAAFTYAIPVAMAGSLGLFHGWTPALWGVLLVVAAAPLTIFGAQQVADVPQAFFVLAVVLVLAIQTTDRERDQFSVTSGALVGLAGLVKDEGLPFMFGMTLAYAGYHLFLRTSPMVARIGRVAAFAIGALPFWLLLWLIHDAAPSVGLTDAFSDSETAAKLLDPTRHWLIIRAFAATVWGWSGTWFLGFGPLFAVALWASGWCLDRRLRGAFGFGGVAILVLSASYYAAFLVTPYELAWHIASLQRIVVHIWPVFVWMFCLAVSFDPDATYGLIGPKWPRLFRDAKGTSSADRAF